MRRYRRKAYIFQNRKAEKICLPCFDGKYAHIFLPASKQEGCNDKNYRKNKKYYYRINPLFRRRAQNKIFGTP